MGHNPSPMWITHLFNLFGRAWDEFLAKSGFTNLSIILGSVVIPLLIAIALNAGDWVQRHKAGVRVMQIVRKSIFGWKTIAPVLITVAVWMLILGFMVVRTVYVDHQALVGANQKLRDKNKTVAERNGELQRTIDGLRNKPVEIPKPPAPEKITWYAPRLQVRKFNGDIASVFAVFPSRDLVKATVQFTFTGSVKRAGLDDNSNSGTKIMNANIELEAPASRVATLRLRQHISPDDPILVTVFGDDNIEVSKLECTNC